MNPETEEQLQKLEQKLNDLEVIIREICPHKEVSINRFQSMSDRKYYLEKTCMLCGKWLGTKEESK